MISPGFFGLYNAYRGLLTAQSGLNVVNHNVANVNTPGFSRQRVDIQTEKPYTAPMMQSLSPYSMLQMGQGSIVEGITRIRDAFLDSQYRLENSILGKNAQAFDVLTQVEGIVGEPENAGINDALQKLFDAAQAMSSHPEDLATRTDFMQQAVDLVNVFQQRARQLDALRENLVGNPAAMGSFSSSQLYIQTDQVNTLLTNLTTLNQQINSVQATGATPNDLMDRRDQMLDTLSKIIEINVDYTTNNQVNVSIGGQLLVRGVTQLDSLEVVPNAGPVPTPDDVPAILQTTNGNVSINNTVQGGSIKALLDMGGVSTTQTTVRGVLGQLNTLITELANSVNALQLSGRDATGNIPTEPIFELAAGTSLAIFRYSANVDLIQNPNLVAAAINDPTASGPPAGFAGVGDGRNALRIAQLRNQSIAALAGGTFGDSFNSTVSRLGIDTRSYEDRQASQKDVINTLGQRRDAISGVNMDEEMIDMMRFQRAFEASSRMIRTFDEVAQAIINLVS